MSFLDQLFGGPLPDFESERPQPPRPPADVPQAGTVRLGEKGAHGYARGGVSVEPWLVDTVRQATRVLPPGYTAEVISTVDPRNYKGGVQTPWHPGGHAIDIQINDPQGNKVPNLGGRDKPGFDIYENMAAAAKAYQQENYPDKTFTWGGHFSGNSIVPADRMHFQSGGGAKGGAFTPDQLKQASIALKAGAAPVQTAAATPLPTPRPATADATSPATTELTAKATPTAPTAPMPTQEQAFSPTLATEQKAPMLEAPAQKAITDAVKPSTGDVAAAAAAPGVPLPQPRPQIASAAPAETPPPNPPPPAAAPARTAAAAPAAAPAPPRITIPPAPATSLGDRMITAMGPRGAGRSAYIDPATQHQILNPGGSGEEAMGITRDLGPLSRQTPARAAPAPQRPAAASPPPGGPAAPSAAPVSPQPNFTGIKTPRSDFSGPAAPTPFAGAMDPLTGVTRLNPDLSGPTPPAPNEAGALAPQPPQLAPKQSPNMGGSLSPFTIGGVTLFPPGSPGANTQPPPPWPTGPVPPAPPPPQTVDQQFGQAQPPGMRQYAGMPWSPFFGQDPQQQQLSLAPFQPDWQSFNATG